MVGARGHPAGLLEDLPYCRDFVDPLSRLGEFRYCAQCRHLVAQQLKLAEGV